MNGKGRIIHFDGEYYVNLNLSNLFQGRRLVKW